MASRRSVLRNLTAAVVVSGLTGCTPSTAEPPAVSPASPAVTPSAEATTPQPSATLSPAFGYDTIGPGFLGPLTVGSTADQVRHLHLLKNGTDDGCHKWNQVGSLTRDGIELEFDYDDDPDDVDAINIYSVTQHSPVHTEAGIGLGASLNAVRRAYGNLPTRTFEGQGDQFTGYILFGSKGALVFGSPIGGTTVFQMTATSGTRLADVVIAGAGC